MTIKELYDVLKDYIDEGNGNLEVYMNKDGMYYTPVLLLIGVELIISDC
jgi:hypothetical protein